MSAPRLKMAARSAFRHRHRNITEARAWVRTVETIMRDVEPDLMAGIRVRCRRLRPWRMVHP